ncbi:MAG TPA: hypothetical protein VKS78_14510, partial [Roseiarcus sp.]|nr:hypothetical protein [Roseiarcus sp.]
GPDKRKLSAAAAQPGVYFLIRLTNHFQESKESKKAAPEGGFKLKTGGVEQSGQEPLENPEEQDDLFHKA